MYMLHHVVFRQVQLCITTQTSFRPFIIHNKCQLLVGQIQIYLYSVCISRERYCHDKRTCFSTKVSKVRYVIGNRSHPHFLCVICSTYLLAYYYASFTSAGLILGKDWYEVSQCSFSIHFTTVVKNLTFQVKASKLPRQNTMVDGEDDTKS